MRIIYQFSSFSCKCESGYTGPYCETLIDNCSTKPCQNGGVCINGVNSYTCSCMFGYTGSE